MQYDEIYRATSVPDKNSSVLLESYRNKNQNKFYKTVKFISHVRDITRNSLDTLQKKTGSFILALHSLNDRGKTNAHIAKGSSQ